MKAKKNSKLDKIIKEIDCYKPATNEILPLYDKWGDEGKWKTVIDFNKLKEGGVSGEEVLKCLK